MWYKKAQQLKNGINFGDWDNDGPIQLDLLGPSEYITTTLSGITEYAGDVTLTDAHTLDQLKIINNATLGIIELSDNGVDLSGSIIATLIEEKIVWLPGDAQ